MLSFVKFRTFQNVRFCEAFKIVPNIPRAYLDLPVKLTSPRRFILTTLRRCKLTTYF